jgi:uncharacterized protein YndB with AHSA1/START domain
MNTAKPGSFDLRITREFDAPPEQVFDQWLNPKHVSYWFAPDGYTVTSCDFRPDKGGSWEVVYASPSESCTERGSFLEVNPPKRLVFTLSQFGSEGVTASETIIVVTFEATANGTRMHFHQSGFETAQRRDDHVVGWGECFDKLSDRLTARTTP